MWLEAQRNQVCTLAGISPTDASVSAALRCAEGLIERFTKARFSPATELLRRVLLSPLLILPLPSDVQSYAVDSYNGVAMSAAYPSTATYRSAYGIELETGAGVPVVWQAGRYYITVTRGYSIIPIDVVKAASLLLAWYVGLSDPERSRYSSLSMGDFNGTLRLSDFPVPEARQLLLYYRESVAVTG